MPDEHGSGRIILLNGASCSGKTTLANALQKVLEEPHLHLCVDNLLAMLPEQCRDWHDPANQRAAHRAVAGLPRCAAALAWEGNNLVIDVTLTTPDQVLEYVYLLDGLQVFFVGVYCEQDELEKRARKRGEKSVEIAAVQARQVHAHGVYDVQIDASQALPLKLAEQVKSHIEAHPQPNAFRRLRSERVNWKAPQKPKG